MPTAMAIGPAPLERAEPLFGAEAMRAADSAAHARHAMPSILLMERAGLATAQAIIDRYAPCRVVVLAGSGNNGGDGLVVARHLAEAGYSVRVLAPGGDRPKTEDAMTNARVAESLGIRIEPFDPELGPPDLIVDAMLGTGARGEPRGAVGEAVGWVEHTGAPVVACDVPTGVDADTGEVAGAAIEAEVTVSYHGNKVGLNIEPGRSRAGVVVVADIGIPSDVRVEASAWRAGRSVLVGLPRKAAASEKYSAGAVLVVAGSVGLVGAAVLASRATLRAGAGLVVTVTAASARAEIATQACEVMVTGGGEQDGGLAPEAMEAIEEQLGRVDAVALGPGLGRNTGTSDLVRLLCDRVEQPLVIDADGLWHLGERPTWLAGRAGPTVLTPHSGEAARLLGWKRADVDARRVEAVGELSESTGAIVDLKGPDSLVRAPGGPLVVNGTGSPALATAGSGDVLTGTVAAMLAHRRIEPFSAVALAVALHGRAGELTGRGDGSVAGDVVEALPAALTES